MFNKNARIDISYTEFDGTHCRLTNLELKYFYTIADEIRASVGRWIPIIPDNHENLEGKSKEALGCFFTSSKEEPFTDDCFITIDTWFIHECYMFEMEGAPSIEPETLVSVIAHELAHSDKFRHCKYHTRLTYLIIAAYNNYTKTGQIRPFDSLVEQLKKEMR